MPLDWGALIPLWFMRAPAVVVSPCRALSNDEHVRAGEALAAATGHRRVALIASADHGHGHTVDGPYGFAPESAEYDEEIQAIVRDNRLGALRGLGPRLRGRGEGRQLLAAPDAARRARRRLRRRAALLRGTDLLRDAHRRVRSAGRTDRAAARSAPSWRAASGPTRPPRRRPAASRSGRCASAAGRGSGSRTPTSIRS